MNTVAIIPARGGSKGLPGKNVKDFCGKPLIAWSIECALAAKGVDSVWVSSDCDEILNISESFGARPIKRPDEISGDTASSESAWLHALDYIEEHESRLNKVVAMQATSPLRSPDDIENALNIFDIECLDSLFSAAAIEDFFIWDKKSDGSFESFNYDYKNRKRRQDCASQYVENGSFYIFKPEVLRTHNNRLGGKIGLSEMSFWKTFEIDKLEDLKFCEVLMKAYLLP